MDRGLRASLIICRSQPRLWECMQAEIRGQLGHTQQWPWTREATSRSGEADGLLEPNPSSSQRKALERGTRCQTLAPQPHCSCVYPRNSMVLVFHTKNTYSLPTQAQACDASAHVVTLCPRGVASPAKTDREVNKATQSSALETVTQWVSAAVGQNWCSCYGQEHGGSSENSE